MNDEFDPYYTWLGIPKEDQPADHYRLIGARQFEDNADVIANVMDQRMQYLRSMQVGKRAALTQKLLNEIATAGGCLLDKTRKRAYDQELRLKQSATGKADKTESPATAASIPAAPAAAATAPRPILVAAAPTPTAPKAAARPLPLPASRRPTSLESLDLQAESQHGNAETKSSPFAGFGKLAVILGGAILGGLLLAAFGLMAAKSYLSATSNVAVAPPKHTVKPAKKGNTTKGNITPEEAPSTTSNDSSLPPKPVETAPAEKPKVVKDPESVPSDGKTWWKNSRQLQGLVALEFSKTAQAEFRKSALAAGLSSAMTVEAWIHLNLEGDKPAQILGTRLGHPGGGFVPKGWAILARKLTTGAAERQQLVLEFWKSNGEFVAYPVVLIKPQDWHHLALTYEPDKGGKFFLDGEKLFDLPPEKDLASSNRNLALGSDLQPDGMDYQAQCCGLRASSGIRYTKSFPPPAPLAMKLDEATFAFLDPRLNAPDKEDKELATSGVQWISLATGALVSRAGSSDAVATAEPRPSTTTKNSEKPNPNLLPNPAPFGSEPLPTKNREPLPVKKVPAPTADDLAQGKSQVTAVFGEDIKAAKSPQAKLELAKKMFEVVPETKDPPSRYVLLQEVRRLALEAKDLEQATAALQRLHEEFEIDLLRQQVKLLEGLPLEGLTAEQRTRALAAACACGQEALAESRIAEAESLANVARQIMAKSVSPEAKAASKVFFDSLAQLRKRFDLLKRAEQTLAASPDDPVANQAVGLHQFFILKNAEEGLAMLVKAGDAKLAAAAKARQKNLENGANKASLEEADAWYFAVSTVPAEYKIDVQRQALEGYSLIASSGTGLEKAKAEKRRDELAAAVASVPERTSAKKTQPGAEVPEFSPGLIGRALVDGKDAGVLLTFNNGLPIDGTRLSQILTDAKGTRGRMVLEGVFALATPATIRVNHLGTTGGPAQILSIDGKKVSAVGAAFGRSSSPTVSLATGTHLVQWICDFDGNNTPMLAIHEESGTGLLPIELQFTKQQKAAAGQYPTKSEVKLNR